jgi:hypothetical protein
VRIARRFNAGKNTASDASPEGTVEGFFANLNRPFGTGNLLMSIPALKRWAIFACPFGTLSKQRLRVFVLSIVSSLRREE